MNLFTRPMKLLTAVVLEQMSDSVVKALLEMGVMDFVHINKLEPQQMEKLSSRPSSVSRVALEDMRHRVEAMLNQGHIQLPSNDILDVKNLEKPDLDAYKATLDALGRKLLTLKEEQKESNQQLLGFEEMRRYITENKGEYLDLRVGEITHGSAEDLASKLATFGGVLEKGNKEGRYITLTLRRDVSQVSPLMDKFGWVETSDPDQQKEAVVVVSQRLEEEFHKATTKRGQIEEQVYAIVKEESPHLFAIWGNLRLNELCDQIRSYFSYTRNTTLFSGWVPADQSEAVTNAIFQSSDGQCVIEWTEATQVPREEVPVAITSPKVLAPFQRIVNNYSTPEYGSINPTIFVMLAYLSMFGLMFADVGQGLVLMLVGLLVGHDYKKNPLKSDGMLSRNLTGLLVYLGASSMVFGVLFGSYFGLSLFPALWFNFDAAVEGHAQAGAIQNVYDILGLTVKFGIIIIYTGLLLNWINLFRKKAYLKLILDKNGLIGGILFGTGLYLGFGFVKTGYKSFPSDSWIGPTLTIAIVLLFFRGFITYGLSLKEGGKKESLVSVFMESFMEWLIDLLEIFTGYLSNTLSFMRVAGLGIAHASLMITFKELADMVGGFGGVVVFIAGNLLVIVLEGLSSGIQSLRLNYYEFFSRYFTGKGVAYEPVGLKTSFSAHK
ncbi:MAG: V-type ATPase 116kDa subunit family protein [Sphaerochaeta sp.]|nr:V-type ATPase 116kDa subunit family protein [Sphaerochaeta sp.]